VSGGARARKRALVVGVGGLGCPAAIALARAGVGTIGLCDDDLVDRSNLHRQILFGDADVGGSKVACAEAALRGWAPRLDVRVHARRLLPGNAIDLVRHYDVVLEGSDNFATKFLAADACALARVPVVHASAVRWIGTALAVGAGGGPCYRCLFEDLPGEGAPNCAEAGVMGPVVGVVAAAQADLALALLDGEVDGTSPATGGSADVLPARRPLPERGRNLAVGQLVTFDGRTGELRRRALAARADCPLCGADVPPMSRIRSIDAQAYAAPACAG
jgi:adenylyltransferase/sulfurtransferase